MVNISYHFKKLGKLKYYLGWGRWWKYYLGGGSGGNTGNTTLEGGGEGKEPTDNWSKERPVCDKDENKICWRFDKDLSKICQRFDKETGS